MQARLTVARVVAVLTCVLVVGAAGFPSKSVSPKNYAKSVCTAVNNWVSAVQAGNGQLQTDLQGGTITSLPEARSSLASYLDSTVSQTNSLVKALGRAGTPSTPKGKQVTKEFQKGFRQVRQVFENAKTTVENMSTTDAAQFKTDAQAVSTQINNGLNGAGSAFNALKKLDPGHSLQKAFKNASACKALNSTSSSG